MSRKPKDRGKTKSLDDMIRDEEKALRRGLIRRKPPQNFFPFAPVRPDRPNPLGLMLDKWDCRILRAIQEHGIKSPKGLCTLGKVPIRKFYERFKENPDLREALKLLAYGTLATALPGAMTTLTEKSPENAKWMELYLKVIGAIDEPSLKIVQKFDGERLLNEQEIQYLIGGR